MVDFLDLRMAIAQLDSFLPVFCLDVLKLHLFGEFWKIVKVNDKGNGENFGSLLDDLLTLAFLKT